MYEWQTVLSRWIALPSGEMMPADGLDLLETISLRHAQPFPVH